MSNSDNYNSTLNLPKTDFPMRANLKNKEPECLKSWENSNIYDEILKRNEGKPVYLLHDGPPYANGDIHLGHALNKILKDFIVKFKNMSGYKAPFVPGWDTHGLPTELKARKKIGLNTAQEISDVELCEICKKFALDYVDKQRAQFKRLGVFADWNNPYITLQPDFVSKQVDVFSKMATEGAIYQGLKPVHWCPTCKTALAEAELEYSEDDCKSIYAKFRVTDDRGIFNKLGINLSKTYFVIWTTTPWSLPGNVAICLGPNYVYDVIEADGNFYIVADALKDVSMSVAKISGYKVIAKFLGKDLEYMKTAHPFLNRESIVIVGNHVTLESGTGCVHTAPGHGIEDFEICREYKDLPILVPIDSNGHLTEEAGIFAGLNISDGSKKIIKYLQEHDLLFAYKDIKHKYPHCWRCKDEVLFRATKQWFCSIDMFKDKAISAIDSVKWIPEWGRDRIKSMVSERKDWCISRQRKWGVPIPILICKKCGKPLIDAQVMGNISKVFANEGIESWFKHPAEYFISENTKCQDCDFSDFEKESDIMDVWFDSGVTHRLLDNFPADLYLEGADQYRGWFQSSLLTSIAVNGGAPYKNVLTHGWVVDEDNRKQSKSLGNGINPQEVIDKYGADILRLWVSSADYHSDVKISNEILTQLSESYRKIRNTTRFIISNLYDFSPDKDFIQYENLFEIDKFILYKLNLLSKSVLKSYNEFEFHNIYHKIQNFCILDLSNFYLDIIKDRLYVYKSDSLERKTAQNTIYIILNHIVRMLAPILSYTCEEIWTYMPHNNNDNIQSIFLNDIILDCDFKFSDEKIKYWNDIRAISDEIKKILEQYRKNKVIGSSLESKITVYFNSQFTAEKINKICSNLKDLLIVSDVDYETVGYGKHNINSLDGMSISVQNADGQKCKRCWSYSESVGKSSDYPDLCSKCIKILSK